MKFLEKNLEDIIMKTNNNILQERGLDIFGSKKRQVRIGNYGICDIVTVDRCVDYYNKKYVEFGVIELKQEIINAKALFQAIRYATGIRSWLEKYKRELSYSINIILIGKSIEASTDFCFVSDLFVADSFQYRNASVSIYTYDYDFDGISFNKESGFKLIDEGF